MQASQVRFDSRFTPEKTRGMTDKRVARRTVTLVKAGSKAFGNAEIRKLFKGV